MSGRIPIVDGVIGERDGQEVVVVGNLVIPVLGVVNCTGKPLPESRETPRRIQEYFQQHKEKKI